MKPKAYSLCVFLLAAITCNCQVSHGIQGSWLIKGGMGLLLENYELTSAYQTNYLTFTDDSVRLESGFFYRTETSDADLKGRHPFVYYGKEERYKVNDDSLFIYHFPYKKWNSFKLKWVNDNELELTSKVKSISLLRENVQQSNVKKNEICYVKVRVVDGPMSLFGLNYGVIVSSSDYWSYRNYDSQNKYVGGFDFTVGKKDFEEICRGFSRVNLKKVKRIYKTSKPDKNIIYVEVALTNGKLIKTELQDSNFPDELRQALVPVLFAHQKYMYGELPPVD